MSETKQGAFALDLYYVWYYTNSVWIPLGKSRTFAECNKLKDSLIYEGFYSYRAFEILPVGVAP